jgi:hypothetical protein
MKVQEGVHTPDHSTLSSTRDPQQRERDAKYMPAKMANLRKTGGRDLLLKRLGIKNSILLVDDFDRHHCAARFVTALFYHSKGSPAQGANQPHQPTGPHATRAPADAATEMPGGVATVARQ